MNFSMSICCAQEQTQILGLALAGGASDSIFPRVESALERNTNQRKAVASLLGAPSSDVFRSFMDLLICSVCPEILPICAAFYVDGALPLRDQITHFGREVLEVLLLAAVEAAWIAYQNQHTLHWAQVRQLLRGLELPPVDLYPAGEVT